MNAAAQAPVATLMQRAVRCVQMDDTVARVEALFAEHQLSWAPVVEPGAGVVGVVAMADLVRLRAQQASTASMPVWQLCTYRPICVGPDTPVATVARLMVERRIHHVVVTGVDGGIDGIVSSLDLLDALAGEATASG